MTKRQTGLRSANLNLVPILRALLQEGSVTRAGAKLGLSPSAVSCALAELRLMMDDPLLVREGRAMQLTPKAEHLIPKLETACLALEDFLHEEAFDPKTTHRTFVVACVDYVGLLVAPILGKRLRETAPDVQVRFIDTPADLERQLTRGAVDACVTALKALGWKVLSGPPACQDRLVGVVDANHPLARRKRVTEADIAAYPALEWELGFRVFRPSMAATVKALQNSKAQIYLHSCCALPMSILGTQMVTTVPGILARRMAADLPLHYFELPHPPIPVESSVVWSSAQEADPPHRWFREQLHAVLAEVHAPRA